MSDWLFKKLAPYALKFREWSKGKIWILILWMLGFFNPYWCVYPVCWIV